ncbi:SDR family NAD(P)-dependent oxidoreductase [Parvularcula oceani]|uniref:SDR family NAD(P)-dependent oxidoreductase n=1 Tax=Parvularcula oceani TaxID=1247963 RepID=UPI0004E167E5|nr:SDR family NAD(P)-dependent oxidoreductase [Parvularcula oceani]
MTNGKLAVVTGASSGIGYELAKLLAQDGYDLILAANEAEIDSVGEKLRSGGVAVETVRTDLATEHGVTALWEKIAGRPVDVLCANAGRGLGEAFLDQEWDRIKEVIDLNTTGMVSLVHKVGRGMRERNEGRILITGSIASFLPGAYQAVYNATKAFAESFSYAIRNELKDTDVTVTCLMPGPVDTEFMERADLENTPVGESDSKSDPAKVAKDGYKAMMKGEPGIVSGFMNKVQVAFAGVLPETMLAEMHRHMAKPKD